MDLDRLTGRLAAGPLKRLLEYPHIKKIARYTTGSVVALLTSVVVFAIMLDAGTGTTWASIGAFFAGAIPNWILNRRWAWEQTGRVSIAREVIGYIVISAIALVASSAATGAVHDWVNSPGNEPLNGLRTILVTGTYVAVQGALFVAKYLVYERWVFAGRSRFRAALRSRHQVWVTARANRTP